MDNSLDSASQALDLPDAAGIPVVVGAGPGGLTAAYQFAKHGIRSVVLEATSEIGGLSQTVHRDGWHFDIGGHRFYTKVAVVRDLWHEILDEKDFLVRPRMSRIYYDGKFYDYPLNAQNALRNLGLVEAVRCVASYICTRVRPPPDQSTFEGYVAARFGWRLYQIFFKTYTEKIMGIPAREIKAAWAAHRMQNLNLMRSVAKALIPAGKYTDNSSLIEEFEYPRLGPGMMWERCAEIVRDSGSLVELDRRVIGIRHDGGVAISVIAEEAGGQVIELACSSIVSTMPLPMLVQAMDPVPTSTVLEATKGFTYRDFLTVALAVPAKEAFSDNWIYIHSPDVRVGRVQNYGAWSSDMIPEQDMTCLGLEYFVREGDDLWTMRDNDLVKLAINELEKLELVSPGLPHEGWVVRMAKAYPMYEGEYKQCINTLRTWLADNVSNVYPIGRNGMHRYNSQDHSMLTAILAVENIVSDADHDLWSVTT